MKIEKIINEIEEIFPIKTAEEFDNVGLLHWWEFALGHSAR